MQNVSQAEELTSTGTNGHFLVHYMKYWIKFYLPIHMCLINVICWGVCMAVFYWGALRHKEGVQGLILVTFSALPCTQFCQIITPVCCTMDTSSECWPPEQVLSQQGYWWCSHCWFQLWMFNLTQLLQHIAWRAWWGKWHLSITVNSKPNILQDSITWNQYVNEYTEYKGSYNLFIHCFS